MQPFDNVIHLEMAVPDALLEHRGNAVAAVQQAFLVVALDGDVGRVLYLIMQAARVGGEEQPFLCPRIVHQIPDRLCCIVRNRKRHHTQRTEHDRLTRNNDFRFTQIQRPCCALRGVQRDAVLDELLRRCAMVLVFMRDKAGGDVRHLKTGAPFKLLVADAALEQNGRVRIAD